MSLTVPVVAARLRREVSAAEAAFDAALLTVGPIAQTIVAARAELDVPVHAGQHALMRLQRAQTQLIAAQTDLFRAHEELARLGEQMMTEEEYTPPMRAAADELDLPKAA